MTARPYFFATMRRDGHMTTLTLVLSPGRSPVTWGIITPAELASIGTALKRLTGVQCVEVSDDGRRLEVYFDSVENADFIGTKAQRTVNCALPNTLGRELV